MCYCFVVFVEAEDGIRELLRFGGLGDVFKRQARGVNENLRLFAGDVDVDLAGVGVGAVFPEVDALPGAEHHRATGDGDAEADTGQRGADVRGHVVVALIIVFINRVGVGGEAREAVPSTHLTLPTIYPG